MLDLADHNHVNCLKWAVTVAAVGYGVFVTLKLRRKQVINPSIRKDCVKIVDTFEIEELGRNTYFCRCWRSAKFPYCDGAHNKHNECTGDNVGPLCVKKKSG